MFACAWRAVLAAALAVVTQSGCDEATTAVPTPVAAVAPWLYPPGPIGWPVGPVRGDFGRSQAPQPVAVLGVAGSQGAPLRLATPWNIPSADTGVALAVPTLTGPALAVMWGQLGAVSAVEVVTIDGGTVLWRDAAQCTGPVVGTTADHVVCVVGNEVHGLTLDGTQRWALEGHYVAMTEDRVAVAAEDGITIHDATDASVLATVKLPSSVASSDVIATCGDSGRELFAARADGTLARIADGKGSSVLAWAAPIPELVELDACEGKSVLARVTEADGTGAVIAFERSSGAITGRVDDVRGWWAARDGSDRVELATSGGIVRASRDLVTTHVISPLVLGALLAARGDLRFVRATPMTAVLLDRDGVAAYVPWALPSAALGDHAILGTAWTGDAGVVRRIAIPPRETRTTRLPLLPPGLALPAELRDLPVVAEVSAAATLATDHVGMGSLVDVALAPEPGTTVLYAVVTEVADGGGGVVALDLATKQTAWQRADGCGPGIPVGVAVARDVVVCATHKATPTANEPGAVVRATGRDGKARWEWTGDHVDRVQASGSVVIASGTDRATVLDAATGQVLGAFASDDGGTPHVLAVAAASGVTEVVAVQRGRLNVYVPAAAMLPVWSLAVNGVVKTLASAGRTLLVELEDGDAFRVDLATAAVTPIAAISLDWMTSEDLLAGTTAGGPIPGPVLPPCPPERPRGRGRAISPPPDGCMPVVWSPVVKVPRGRKPLPVPPDVDRPPIATPHPIPPPLGQAWHLALYEPTGELRVRNEYPLFGPIVPGVGRAGAAAPIVVRSGAERREVLVIDPQTGDPLRRVLLPEDAAGAITGGVVVGGHPMAFAVYPRPLRVALF